jgi:hypothetical protein
LSIFGALVRIFNNDGLNIHKTLKPMVEDVHELVSRHGGISDEQQKIKDILHVQIQNLFFWSIKNRENRLQQCYLLVTAFSQY